MPRYKVDEKVYNLPEDKVSQFKQAYPEAVLLDEDLGNSKGSQNTDATAESNSTASTSENTSLESQSTAIDKLEESFQKARLSDSEIKEANDRGISAVNQYYSDYSTFQSYQEEKANRKDVNDESFILEGGGFNYELMLEQNNASTYSADQTSRAEVVPSFDSNIHNKIKQINQNKAFYKYVNDKNINLSNLNEEELADKKSQILNSEEFTKYLDVEEKATRDYGEKIADLDRQLRVATTEGERKTILNKIANIEKDNPAHEEVVLLQQRENRANDIEDKVIEQVDEMGFRFWSRGDEQEDLIEAAAIKEGNLKNKSEGLLSKIEVLSKQSETTYNEMLTLNNWFNTTGKEYQKEMKQIASKQYTSQEDLDDAKEKIKTLQQEYNGKVNTYETLKQTGLDQSALNTKLQSQFQDLNIEVEEFAAYSSGIKRNPGQLTAFFANIGNSTIDLAQGIINTVDMVSQIPDEFLKEIDDPGVRSFLQTTYNIVNPVFADGTDGVSLWDDAKKGIDEWQYKNVTSKIRKPIQFDEIESVSDSVEYGANLLATQIPNLALMYATGGSSLYFLGASSAGSKYDSMQKEKEMFYNTGGLYGHDHSFGAMFLNSSFTGTTESLSERVTLGAVNRTAKSLFRNLDDITIKKGYKKYLKDNVFTYKNTKATALEFNEEGFSEFLATASGNFADIVSGKNVNIYDGGLESYVSGALISGSIQSPRLYKALIAPFKTSQTNQRLQVINNRVDQINQEILDLTKSKDPNAAEQLQKLKDERIQLVDEYHKASEKDIKRVNLLDQEQKTELVEIDKSKQDIARRIKEVQSSELNQAEKDAELKKLNKEYLDGQKRKDQILNSIPDDAIPAGYAQEVEAMKAYEKKIKDRGVVEISFVEKTQQEFEDMIAQDQTGNQLKSKAELEDFVMKAGGTAVAMQEIIDNPNSTEAEKQEAREALQFQSDQTMAGVGMLDFIAGNARNYGAMAPRFDDKGNLVGLEMNINKSTALTDGQFNVPSHEFVHAAFYNTLKADPVAQETMGNVVDDIIDAGDIEFLPGQKEAFDKKINMYEGNVKGEEKLAFLTEFVRGNKAKIKESGLQKIKGMFRRFAQNYLGREIKLDTNQDILNFIKDYDVSVQNNKPSPAIIKMMEKGANGKIFKDARSPQERKDQMMYSKALNSNLKNNPDLKQTFDKRVQNPDGTKKYETQEDFSVSPDFTEAYLDIVEGRSLDALIQQGMTEKGLPPEALRDFTRKVKEELGRRFLTNYNLDKNDSLFGWLTGVSGGAGMSIIYRAKGDVMNQYKAEQQADTVSIDAPIGEAGTIADIISDDSSVASAIENEDLSIGRRNAIRDIAQNELIAKDELKLSQDAKDAIRDVVAEANIPLDGLTYKGLKKLLVESMKVDKNGKLKPPTKESDVVPVGALYNVLEITASEFGVDPARILANQDLDANQRRLAQEKILDLSINSDGSFNDILFQLLPEGETRSGEATGVANTKLGDFYITGDRVKVSEGASKALGQKKEQNKKARITKKEFLDKFGINEDGTLRAGTSADGAIRALVVQMAQLNANQEVRINALENGTASEAVTAKLGDGKSELVFSKADPTQDVVAESWPELVMTAAGARDAKEVEIAVDSVYGNSLDTRQRKSVVNQITKDINRFIETNEKFKGRLEQANLQSETDFILNQWQDRQWQQGINYALKGLPNIPDGFKAGNVATDIEGATKARGNLKVAARGIMDKFGVAEGLRLTIAHLQPAYAGAGKIGTGALTVDKPGGNVIVNKNPTRGPENRMQVVESKEDFDALIKQALPPGYSFEKTGKSTYTITSPDGNTQNIETALHGEDSASFLKDKDYEGRKKASQEARDLVELLTTEAYNRVQSSDSFNEQDFGFLIMTLGSSMKAPIRRAANAEFIQEGIEELFAKNPSKINQLTQYEHMKSKELVSTQIILGFKNNGKFDKSVFDGYHVQVITKEHDKLINKAGYMTKSTPDGSPRAYSLGVLEQIVDDPSKLQFVKPMRSLDPAKQSNDVMLDISTNFVKIAEALAGGNIPTAKQMSLLGAATSRLAFSKAPSPRGMSAFDFDETLIIDGDNFIIATDPVTGKETKISSGNWPLKGPELMEQGYEFDFSDFINVRGGVEGPLFQKFKNRIAKYGPENNYILTARPAEAAIAIHGWLKSKGINIPLENITGLGNSTGAAKAEWMLRKFEEGYNDMYFVDDALPNVEAVANIIDQLDIKGKSVQAKLNFSKENPSPIDDMLERNKDVPADETFNRVKARNKGKQNRKRQLFIPPSADDFEGLMYYNYGKGEQGNSDAKFFKQKFYDPFNRADRQLDMYKQKLREDVKKISKALPKISKNLNKEFENSGYTNEQAMRIYLYDQNGHSVPGISEAEQKRVARNVAKNQDMVLFAGSIEAAIGVDGYLKPQVGWNASSFNGDMADAAKIKRKEYLEEWQVNVDEYFTEDMLNKLEAIHGSAYRAALEDTLARMKSGTNRPTIRNKHVNAFLDWLNGSVGAIMFFNARSAVLQTLSTVNFINFEDNNIFAAAKAFANQKQYWQDFSMLFNSPMLRQRRGGLQSDLNASELQRLAEKGGVKAVVGRLLELGFAPTQIADSFAISAGGSTFYRNRVNKYIKEGMSQKQAEDQAFIDFQETAEATQQSSRPDKISQEQASVLGRLILAFQNTPMQYNRLIKKAALDLINNRGDWKSNISRIIYYGAAQNIIFSSLQSALFAVAWDDDDEDDFLDTKLERIANGTLDSLLRGSGIYGAVLSTVKNTVLKYVSEREKGMQADNGRVLVEALNVSPPLGSKARKLYSAMTTDKWNKGVYNKIPLYNVDNPIWDVTGNLVEASFNIPLARIQRKLSNLKAASDNDNANWQRLALLAGWDKWSLGIERPEEIEEARQEVKEEKREQKKQDRKAKEVKSKEEKEKKYLEDQKKEKEENKKPRCAAATKNGSRCKGEPVDGTYCTIHTKVEKRSDGKKTQCKKIKSDGERCKMQTNSKSGFCYYHD